MPIRKVTDPALLQQLGGSGQVVAPNPMFPGQLEGQGLNNRGQQLQNTERTLTLPYAAPKAAADASNAATQAQVNAATAPAEIRQKNANARQTEAQATTAERNLETTGGSNEGQAKSASFYTRATRANSLYEGTGVTDDPMGRETLKAILPDALVNSFTSPERQRAEAAQRDFIASTLRYESGANIPQNEFDLQRSIYFPAPGDDPTTIQLKGQLRKNAIEGLRVASGPAGAMLDAAQPTITASNPPPKIFGDNAAPQMEVATGKTATEPNPQVSAGMDRLIRMGRPVGEIVAWAKAQGADITPEVINEIAAARLYAKQNPGYRGGFTQATITRPTTLGERIAGSPLGAFGSAMGTAATAGFNDELAGAINAAQGGSYAEGRDAFNAGKQLVADAHPIADFAGTALGSALTMGAAGRAIQGTRLASLVSPAARYGQTAEQAAQIGATRAATLGDMAYGGAFGAGETNDDRALGALTGTGAALGGNLIGRAGANTLGAIVSPTGGKAAPLYELGVRPSIGQRFGGIVNNFEEKLKSIPLAGDLIEGTRDKARDQFQVGLFNKSLGEIGQKLPKGMGPGHDAHAFAQNAFNNAYDAAKSNMVAVADNGLATDIGNLQRTVATLKPDSQNAFNKIWSDSVARRFSNGTLSGSAYKDATSEIEKRIALIRKNQSGDGELANALQEAADALQGSAMRNSPPEAVAAMDAVDRGYATLVQLETASRGSTGEAAATFLPKQFESAVKNTNSTVRKRGYLAGNAHNADIAAAGLRLGDVVSNSGSIDRLLPASLLLGSGFLSPKWAGLMGAYGLANAPVLRDLTTSIFAPRQNATARKLGDLIRKQSGIAGTLGSGAGIALLPPQ